MTTLPEAPQEIMTLQTMEISQVLLELDTNFSSQTTTFQNAKTP